MQKNMFEIYVGILLFIVAFSGCIEDESDYITIQGLLIPSQTDGDKLMFFIIEGFTLEIWMDIWTNGSSDYDGGYPEIHTFILTRNGEIITESDAGDFTVELDGKYGMGDVIKVTGIVGNIEKENPDGDVSIINSLEVKSIVMVNEYETPSESDSDDFAGSGIDRGHSVQQTLDGGYIITGYTSSYGCGSDDVWLIKANVIGVEEWNQTFGGGNGDQGKSVKQTTDGGYIIAGGTYVNEINYSDVFLIKTDENGIEQWNQTYGGKDSEHGESVQQTSDGGYIITGYRSPIDRFAFEVILIKTDSLGNEQWNQTFGLKNHINQGWYVIQTSDEGYILTGRTDSYGAGELDVWLIKTDENGNELWNQTFGGTSDDFGYSVQQTSDGGYIVSGGSLLIKTDENGNELWSKTFSGGTRLGSFSMQQTNDRGYILTGYLVSYGSVDDDVWLIKTDENGNELWNQTFGGGSTDIGYSVFETTDNGYIIAGFTNSYGAGFSDVWLIKTDSSGIEQWKKTFG
jgi:hypothetical protein